MAADTIVSGSAAAAALRFADGEHTQRRYHFLRAAVIGLAAGLIAVGFRRALAAAEQGRTELLTQLHTHPLWGWAVLPLIGLVTGALVGLATQRLCPEAAGSGIPHLKGVLLHLRRLSWRRLLPIKFLAGVAGIGAGLSLGREGPTVQMGAAVARALAGPLRASGADLPQLFSAGAGAGLAAAFNAPLAGLMFVVEELHRELSSRTAGGALIAAVCATVVTQWLAGNTPSFEVHGLSHMPLAALPIAVVIGVLGGIGGVVFNRGLLAGQAAAQRQQRVPAWLLPGIIAALIGTVAWWLPQAAGGGHGVAEHILGGAAEMGLGLLLLLLLVKFACTIASYSSGAPGGIFAPMLLLGALLGAILGKSLAGLSGVLEEHERTLAVLGMAAFFVGSVRAPLTGIVLISEMTDGYQLLFPICIVAVTAYLTAEGFRDVPIYDALLHADLQRSGLGARQPEPRTIYIGVQSRSALAGKRLIEAGLPRGCLVVALERGGANLLPSADTRLMPGDHVWIMTPGEAPEAPLEIVRLCTGL